MPSRSGVSARLKQSDLNQRTTLNGYAVHQAKIAVIIIEGIMPRGPIVPKDDRARLPNKAGGEGRVDCVLVEVT